MLFIKEYNAKSLDRSSVSMIDKYNVRLDIVGKLLDNLSSLINNLLSLIRDIRTSLGQSKQRIYNNLDQVKEVIEGNDITGTESTIEAIESALEAGDKAIDEAEATLEGIEAAINCSEEYCDDATVDVECGETCNETPSDEGCNVCGFSVSNGFDTDNCTVCSHGACTVDLDCSEDKPWDSDAKPGCSHSVTYTNNGTVETDERCQETYRDGVTDNPPRDCVYTCNDASPCQQFPMPEDCTYTCVDGDIGCSYEGEDCSYSSICGQPELCNETECEQYDCGEPCGETCHMTSDDCSESCSEDCSEDCGEGACNQFDCSEYDCGEACGETCGL